MSIQTKLNSQQFKQDVFKYIQKHPDLTLVECATSIGLELSTLSCWRQQYDSYDGSVPTRSSENYASDELKEIARLKQEFRDTLKSHQHPGKRLTTAIYIEVAAKMEADRAEELWGSLSQMLRIIGVSRSNYRAFIGKENESMNVHSISA